MRSKTVDIPQTPKAIKLLNTLDELNHQLKELKSQHKKEQDTLRHLQEIASSKITKKIFKAQESLQEVCAHNKLEITDDFDYHRREEWTITDCAICKKRISRV